MARLGSAKSVHAKQRDTAFHDVQSLTRALDSHLEAGDCRRAVKALAGAASAWGAFNAHFKAVDGAAPTGHVTVNAMDNQYHALKEAVLTRCVRTTPGLAGARRRLKVR